MSFIVGPGVQAAIDENEDQARSNEMAMALTDGGEWAVTLTVGQNGLYYWIKEDNRVNVVPFEE